MGKKINKSILKKQIKIYIGLRNLAINHGEIEAAEKFDGLINDLKLELEKYTCPDEIITKIEDRQEVLNGEFHKIISRPVSDDSIKEAETKGAEIISESIDNGIMLDILNWDDDSKLSNAGLKFKKSKEE